MRITHAPTTLDVLECFGIEPVEARPEDGAWCYAFASGPGEELRLSFNVLEGSVQTAWFSRGRPTCVVSHENASEIRLDGTSIEVEFSSQPGECRTRLSVQVRPRVEVRWSSVLI